MKAIMAAALAVGLTGLAGQALAGDLSYELGVKALAGGAEQTQKTFELPSDGGERVSKLEWTDVTNLSVEVQGVVKHAKSGLRVRGVYGVGRNRDGSLDDEDFISTAIFNGVGGSNPANIGKKFSDTRSDLANQRSSNWSVDLGWTAPKTWLGVQATPFVGYFKLTDRYLAKGLVLNPDDFGGAAAGGPPGTVILGPTESAIGSKATWKGVELGVDLKADLNDKSFVAVTVAGMPGIGRFRYEDSHFQRTDQGPTPNFITTAKKASSLRLEGAYGYRLTEAVTLSVGARYWTLKSGDGDTVVGARLPVDQQDGSIDTMRLKRASAFVGVSYSF